MALAATATLGIRQAPVISQAGSVRRERRKPIPIQAATPSTQAVAKLTAWTWSRFQILPIGRTSWTKFSQIGRMRGSTSAKKPWRQLG